MSDFWKTLAGNSSTQLLTGSMDSLLGGRENGPDFEKMRVLTDVYREANALELPIEAGTKVSFLGTLGAYMGYDNPPSEGSVGEVVPVKSANGDVTYHEGKVFVQWDDGEFRSIHAEHLRLASDKTTKTSREKAPKLPTGLEKSTQREWAALQRVVKGRTVRGKFADAFDTFESKSREDWGTDQKAMNAVKAALIWVKAEYERKSGNGWHTGRPLKKAADIKQQFEKIKGMAKEKPDNDFLKSLLKQMADKGFAPTDKQMAVVKKIEDEIKQQGQMKKELKTLDKKGEFDAADIGKKHTGPLVTESEDKKIMDHFGQGDLHELSDIAKSAAKPLGKGRNGYIAYYKRKQVEVKADTSLEAQEIAAEHFRARKRYEVSVVLAEKGGRQVTHDPVFASGFRVASLGDLTDFLKSADGQLIHRSTNDLWSVAADDNGFTITRLFDDNGDPLKG